LIPKRPIHSVPVASHLHDPVGYESHTIVVFPHHEHSLAIEEFHSRILGCDLESRNLRLVFGVVVTDHIFVMGSYKGLAF
jgi:hypothetical protein